MGKSTLVILNPAANGGRAARLRPQLAARLTGHAADLIETTSSRQGKDLARQAASNGQRIVAIGGDGTIHEVIEGIISSGCRVPLGVVGAGSGNDYVVRTLHLPVAPLEALEVALTGTPTPYDAGLVNEYVFNNSFGVGLDANIACYTEHLKVLAARGLFFLQGPLLYVVATLQQLLFHYHECPTLTFTGDDTFAAVAEHLVLVAVTIGPSYGGGFFINPGADPQDGLLDVCQIKFVPLLRALQVLPQVKAGQHTHLPEVQMRRVTSLTITSPRLLKAHLDGEIITADHFRISILPEALLIVR